MLETLLETVFETLLETRLETLRESRLETTVESWESLDRRKAARTVISLPCGLPLSGRDRYRSSARRATVVPQSSAAMAEASAAAAALLLLLLLASGADCAASRQQQQQDGGGYLVEGRVRVEALADKVAASVKLLLNGGQRVTFLQPGGYFAFHGVPPGTHLLEVAAPGYAFAPVRLDVSERLRGDVHAIYTETRRILPDPLLLEPALVEQYYEKREPFSVLGLLKSPMGLMVGFMGLAVFVLPKLMDSIDPEEMKRVQEEMRNRPAPSFSNLLQGRSS